MNSSFTMPFTVWRARCLLYFAIIWGGVLVGRIDWGGGEGNGK